MLLPRGTVEAAELDKRVKGLAPWPDGVVNLRYSVADDWSGDPAIFFWITLSDDAARREVLGQTSRRVRGFIEERLDPMGQWGLLSYVSFRSESEQAMLKDKVFG